MMELLLAGEGSSKKRGLRPLSNFSPSPNILLMKIVHHCCLERGIKGVRLREGLNGVKAI